MKSTNPQTRSYSKHHLARRPALVGKNPALADRAGTAQ